MTHTTIKRTYRVEFSSYTRMCIEGASQGVYAYYGWHDLLDHSHPDDQFMALDPASRGYIEAVKDYKKKYNGLLSRTKTKLFKEKNTSAIEFKNKIKTLEKIFHEEKDRAARAKTKAEGTRIRKQKGGMLEIQDKLRELRAVYDSIEDEAYEITNQKLGDGPSRETYWKPIFDRMYWQFDHVSPSIPSWIEERDYCVVNQEEIIQEQRVTKLERVEPKGSGVNWKSRNRGGKVTVSSRGFDKTATKVYPKHLKNE
jgi:hypothetical protein